MTRGSGASNESATRAKRWLKTHQHDLGIRQALDLGERAYELMNRVRGARHVPAFAGGRPTRLVPFPDPEPYRRRERLELDRAISAQNTSFSDGDALERFERALAQHWGCKHAIAVSSGSAALHASMIAADIRRGDEVIVPVLTHVSTLLAVLYQGAVPRFIDADATSWNLDPSKIEALVTNKTRAIVAVHLCGVPCDMDRIRAIAVRHELRIIEDAAHAHGSLYGGRKAGTLGHLGCLSFQSDKTLTTGEGGAVLTDDDELALRVRSAMSLGVLEGATSSAATSSSSTSSSRGARGSASIALDHRPQLSWNYRMSALQAALGLGQLRRLDDVCAVRRANAAHLARQLADLPGVRPQGVSARAAPCHAYYFVEIGCDGKGPSRDDLAEELTRERIDYRLPYAEPLARHVFARHAIATANLSEHPTAPNPSQLFPCAERICAQGIGFRVDPALGKREMDTVAFALRRIFDWVRSH